MFWSVFGNLWIIRQELVARDFGSAESTEIAGILCVFPNFGTARMGQKTRHPAVAELFRGSFDYKKMKKGLRLADGVLPTWVLFYFSLSSVRSIISCAPSRSPAKGNPFMLGVYRPAKTLDYSPGGVGRQIFVQCMVCLILGEEQAPRLPKYPVFFRRF